MEKYVYIEITSAKFPVYAPSFGIKNSKDDYVINHLDGRVEERNDSDYIDVRTIDKETDLFTTHQVSGMLHVLLGARPVSHLHGSLYKSCPIIDEMAKKCLVKATNKFVFVKDNGKKCIYAEITNSKKACWNSDVKGIVTFDRDGNSHNGKLTWDTFRRRFMCSTIKKYNGISKYQYIMNFLHSVCPDESYFEKYDFIDFMKELSKDEVIKEKMIRFFNDDITEQKGAKLFTNIINGINGNTGFQSTNSSNNFAAITNCNGLKPKVTLNGIIMVPVTNSEAEDFIKGVRNATFGDNGLASVIEVVEADEDDLIYDQNFVHIYK